MTVERDHLISFTSRCSLRGAYDGQVMLTNDTGVYGPSNRWNPFKLKLDATSICVDACFTGSDIFWIYGVVLAVNSQADEQGKWVALLKIGSFVSKHSKKPINTELYKDATIQTVLGDVLGTYAALPAALYDITGIVDTRLLWGIVSGNNLIEEAKKLAHVAHCELYVTRDGIFTANPWNDGSSGVDINIPEEALINTSFNADTSLVPSRVIVRGKFISAFDAGERVLSAEDWENPFTPKEFNPSNQSGKIRKCVNVGINQPEVTLKLKNLLGNDVDLKNATFEVEGDGEFNFVRKIDDGGFAVISVVGVDEPPGSNPDKFIGQGTKEFQVIVKGKHRPAVEATAAASQQRPLQANGLYYGQIIGRMSSNMTGLPLAELPELGDGGGKDLDKMADEPEPMRIEMVVGDADLQAEYGIVTAQVDNLYISDMEGLFEQGIRRLQEGKMRRNAWIVNCVYLPCIELNKVVSFTALDGTAVTGVVVEIDVGYTASGPSANMKLVVHSIEDVGGTNYTSDNLLIYPDLIGSNVDYGWKPTVTGGGVINMMGGYCAFYSVGSGAAYIEQDLQCEIGGDYVLSCDIKGSHGGATFEQKIIMGSTISDGVTMPGDLSPSRAFVADQEAVTVRYGVTAAGADWGGWLANPYLTKTVTR